MLKKIINHHIAQGILASLLASVVVSLVFFTYLLLIGIPKTEARNLYNNAVISFEQGNNPQGIKLLKEAYSIWPESYIYEELITRQQATNTP